MLIDRFAASLRRRLRTAGRRDPRRRQGRNAGHTRACSPGTRRFALRALPRPMLVVVSGEEAAERFWRQTAAYLGKERVLRLPDRSDLPWRDSPDLEQSGACASAPCTRPQPPGRSSSRLRARCSGRCRHRAVTSSILSCSPRAASSILRPRPHASRRWATCAPMPTLRAFSRSAAASSTSSLRAAAIPCVRNCSAMRSKASGATCPVQARASATANRSRSSPSAN